MAGYAESEFKKCIGELEFTYDSSNNTLEMNGSTVSAFVETISVERPSRPQRRIPICEVFQTTQAKNRCFMFGICPENNFIVSFEGVIYVKDRIDIVDLIEKAQQLFDSNPATDFFRYSGSNFVSTKDKIRYISFIKYKDKQNFTLDALKHYLEIFDSRMMALSDMESQEIDQTKELNLPLQLIFYGAPGAGKSRTTNDVIECYSAIRTTFHPDSNYSTFVGSYKPTMGTKDCYGLNGKDTVRMKDAIGNDLTEDTIIYKFTKQAFLKSYVNAWKLWVRTCNAEDKLKPQFLIIEEINRGNCAQIFGDIFQLLDRKKGFSEYPIEADEEICASLLEDETEENSSFGKGGLDFSEEQKNLINSIYDIKGKPSKNIAEKIAVGKVLVLPSNFYIWATMNTSDQSLLPMDSAFKRRWDWKYIPIEQASQDMEGNPRKWKIKADGCYCYWWEFLQAINDEIEEVSHSEDKQLGYYFAKPDDGEYITAKYFVSKVIFYLWNDIFKDEDSSIFQFEALDGKWDVPGYKPKKDRLYFRSFIKSKESVDEQLVRWFINNLLKMKNISLLDDVNQNPQENDIAYMRKINDGFDGATTPDSDETDSEATDSK